MAFLIAAFCIVLCFIWLSFPRSVSIEENYKSYQDTKAKTITNKDQDLKANDTSNKNSSSYTNKEYSKRNNNDFKKEHNADNLFNEAIKAESERLDNLVSLKYSQELFSEAIKAESEGFYNLALLKYSQAVEIRELINIPNSTYYGSIARVKIQLKDFSGALIGYTKAILVDPGNPYYILKRGLVNYDLGAKSFAKSDLESAANLGSQEARQLLIELFENIDKVSEDSVISTVEDSIFSTNQPVEPFVPSLKYKFSISAVNDQYEWYALFDYYPKNRFSESELSYMDIQSRQHVFAFKDGSSPRIYADMLASALINKFGKAHLSEKYILIIPASSKLKTRLRFQKFCKTISENIGAIDGFTLLNNNNLERTPANQGGKRNENLEQYLSISDDLINKEVIIVDDVRTSGSSSNQIFEILRKRGVSKITFVYLAKTVSLNFNVNSI